MSQITVQQLRNNTFIVDYFRFLNKILDEGYTLTFMGLSEDNTTTIKNILHLKNYLKSIAGLQSIEIFE